MTKTYFIDQDINNDNVRNFQIAKKKRNVCKIIVFVLEKDTNVLYGKKYGLNGLIRPTEMC